MKNIIVVTSILLFCISCETDNPPKCIIVSPKNDSEISIGEVVTVSVFAEDDIEIKEVQLFLNEIGHQSIEKFPYNFTWDTRSAEIGIVTIRATAIDNSGQKANSEIDVYIIGLPPQLVTSPASFVDDSSAVLGGEIINNGSSPINERGILFSLNSQDDLNSNRIVIETSDPIFSTTVKGLIPNTKYYVRSYATNNDATGYGNEISFTTDEGSKVPTVNTNEIELISVNSAVSGGSIVYNGGEFITESGVCWSTSPNPTVQDSHTVDSFGDNSYLSSIMRLASNTTYYVKAYAKNIIGIGYGNEVEFKTKNYGSSGTITDIEGNIYQTITIGTQTWMSENLRTTKFNDNTNIERVADSLEWINSASPAYCWYKNDSLRYSTLFGILYNGYNLDNENICPTGWHVPTDEDWTVLTDYLGGLEIAGGKLKEATSSYWSVKSSGATNESGFTGLPSGGRSGDGSFFNEESYGWFWSSTWFEVEGKYAIRYLRSLYDNLYRASGYYNMGFSIRCIKDE